MLFIDMKGKTFGIAMPASQYAVTAGRRIAAADTASPLNNGMHHSVDGDLLFAVALRAGALARGIL